MRVVGPLGSGTRLKLVANSYLAITHAAAAELLAAGRAAGLSAGAVWPLLTRLVPYLDARRAGFLDAVYEPVTFRVGDLLKDVGLALDLYRRSGSFTPISAAALDVFTRAAAEHADDDIPAVSEAFRAT